VLAAVARFGGTAGAPVPRADLVVLRALLPAARAQDLQRQLPGLTSGEGVAETGFGGYRPVTGPPPIRRRTLADPLNREEYMMQLAGRATAASAEQAESSGAR
jgi:ribosomal protection tetracycline resistance protein